MTVRRAALAGLALLSAGLLAAEPGCEEVFALLQKRFGKPQVVTATFRHTLKAKTLNQTEVEEGRLTLAPGGLTRWQYSRPKGKIAVSDGERFWLYLPDENQVYVQPARAGESAPLALRLLSGLVDFRKEFDCLSAAREGSSWNVRMRVIGPGAGVEALDVRLSETGLLERVGYSDAVGNEIAFELSDVAVGGPAPDPALFRFKPPKGARVIQGE